MRFSSIQRQASWSESEFADCTLLKASKSKRLLLCPADSTSQNQFLLVKIYYYPGLLQKAKYLFRRSKARRELDLSEKIREKGIPTIVPQAVKDTRKWGLLKQSMIITEYLPDCLNLEDLLLKQPFPDKHLKRRILEAYGRLARRIHDQGIYQDDFDPNNILYEKKQNGTFQLYFLDIERTRIVNELSRKKRIHLLAKLNRMGRRLPQTDQMRFLTAYLGDKAAKEEKREWIRRIKEEEEKVFHRDQRRAWKQCCLPGTRIGLVRYKKYRGYYRKKHHSNPLYSRSDMLRLIQTIEKDFPETTLRQYASGWVFELTLKLDEKEENFQVRFFRYNGLKTHFQRMLKQTPLLAAWKTDNGCLKNRTADIMPVAALEKKIGFNRCHGFLVRQG